jgi:N,N'-diacetyllegionaminate synthase
MKTFFIAEIGVNHNGDLRLALDLVDAAAHAGAGAAKFQTFRADAITVKNAGTVAYQKRAAGTDDQHAMLKKLELSGEEHESIAAHCAKRGIEFMSTAFDGESLELLCRLGIKRIKSPSGEVTNEPFLRELASKGLPIILSTGMSTLDEVRRAVAVIETAWAEGGNAPKGYSALTILHCTSSYPTEFADANLLAMTMMAAELCRPVGYSDHTQGIFVPPVAVAMGAQVIEKHITLDRMMNGPDHASSIEPDELVRLIKNIRDVESLLGDGVKKPRDAELEARQLVRRGLKAARDLAPGTVLGKDDVSILRPGTGLPPARIDSIVGARLTCRLAAGDPILDAHF